MNDIDDEYRRASAQDPGQPAEATRRNILAHAAELAAQRTAEKDPLSADFRRPAANQSSWRPALIGTLAAAGLAGLLVTPLFLPPHEPVSSDTSLAVSGKAPPLYTPETASDLPAGPTRYTATPPPARASRQLERKIEATAGPAAADSQVQGYVPPPEPAAVSRSAPRAWTNETADNATTAQAQQAAPAAMPQQRNFAEQGGALFGGITADAARQKSASSLSSAAPAPPAAALRRAAESGDLASMQVLLAGSIDINARDNQGCTALMLAIRRGQSDAVNLLLAHGADANVADSDGVTPLQAARAGTQPAITAALQRAGAH